MVQKTSANKFYKYDISTIGFTRLQHLIHNRIITVQDQYTDSNNKGDLILG